MKKKQTKKNTRDDCLRMSILSEDNARKTLCTGKFCPFVSIEVRSTKEGDITSYRAIVGFWKVVRPWNVVAVFLSVEGMSGMVGGGGYERWMIPLVRGCGGRPQENFLIQDVCRSDSNAFWGISFLSYQAYFTSISCISDANDIFLNPPPHPPAMY